MAEGYHALGELDVALVYYEKAVGTSHRKVEHLMGRAKCCMDMGDYGSAIEDYLEAHEKEKDDIGIMTKLAQAYFAEQNFKKCNSTLKMALKAQKQKDVENPDILQLQGSCLYHQRKFLDAADHFSRCLELDGKNVRAYLERAKCFQTQEDHKSAIVDLDKAIELDPQNVDAYFRRSLSLKIEKHFP